MKAMNAMMRGCLAGAGVCFISHQGGIYPCGSLPIGAGNLRRQSFADVWRIPQYWPLFVMSGI